MTDDQLFLRRAIREFAEAELRPNVMAWDEAQAFPQDLLPKLARGWRRCRLRDGRRTACR